MNDNTGQTISTEVILSFFFFFFSTLLLGFIIIIFLFFFIFTFGVLKAKKRESLLCHGDLESWA